MAIVLLIAVLLIGFFICVVNMIFRSIEIKNLSEWKKNSRFNSPKAWGIYAFCIAVVIGGLFMYSLSNIITGYSSVGKAQQTLTQQQQEINSSEEQQDTAN
ncbi:MAG: hypothetical protein ACM3X7_00195 [Solirubrobacterales bacterium]